MKRQMLIGTGLALISTLILTGCGQTGGGKTVSVTTSSANGVTNVTAGGTPSNISPSNQAQGTGSAGSNSSKGIGNSPASSDTTSNASDNSGTDSSQPPTGSSTAPSGTSSTSSIAFSKFGAKPLVGASFVSSKVGFVASQDAIYRTNNGGDTWMKLYDSHTPILGIQAKFQPTGDKVYVLAFTKSMLLRSSDGLHFTKQGVGGNTDGGSNPNLEQVSLLGNDGVFVLNDGVVWASDPMNGGLSRRTPTTGVSAIAALDMNTCFAVSGETVYETTDAGQHWAKVFTAPIRSLPWKAQIEVNGSHVAVLFYGGAAGMSQQAFILFDSNDSGKTWRPFFDEGYFADAYGSQKPLNPIQVGEQPGGFTMDSQGDVFMTALDMNGNTTTLTEFSPAGNTLVNVAVDKTPTASNPFDYFKEPVTITTFDGKHLFVLGTKGDHGVIEMSGDGGKSFHAN